jgi:hypothetical protein
MFRKNQNTGINKIDSYPIQFVKKHKNIRILEVGPDFLIGASGYKLFRFENGKWICFSGIHDIKYSFLSKFRLTSRLLRAEIYCYNTLRHNKGICVARKGIFLENELTGKFEKVFHVLRGSRPLTICEDRDGNLYFGEYFNNETRSEVNVYTSLDAGKNWNIIYTFPKNTIRHIHGIQMDPFTGYLWIITGDEDGECIIACTADKFRNLDIIARGGQEFRTCRLLFLKDKIIFGTDSPYEVNYIKSINRKDLTFHNLQEVQGSVINACQINQKCMISTTVEPSTINTDCFSYLWISQNGDNWHQIAAYEKDVFGMDLFQLGTIQFPHYHSTGSNSIYFSGQALKGIDGHTIELKDLNNF